MNTEQMINKITSIAIEAQKCAIDPEALQSNMEDGWGGNGDDAFNGGFDEGKADLGAQITAVLEEFVASNK